MADRKRAGWRTGLGCLGAALVPVGIVVVVLVIAGVVGAATRNAEPGTTESGTLSRDSDTRIEVTYRSTARASEVQAERWGRSVLGTNDPSEGTPYVVVAELELPDGGRVSEDDLRSFTIGVEHDDERSGSNVEPTDAADPVDGCVTTAAALADALSDGGPVRSCSLVRLSATPEVVSAGQLYRLERVRRTSHTRVFRAHWEVGDIGVWSGRVD